MNGLRVLAPAKINTRLDVLAKRSDGYHELDTFLVALDLADEIRVTIATHGAVRLTLSGPQASKDIPRDEQNLAARAARMVLEEAKKRGLARAETGLDLALEKRIPSQAGLGGGSSDAAAAWLGCARLLEVAYTAAERDAELATLGSDTVFFAAAQGQGAAWCSGRGEIVTPAVAPRAWSIALVTPAVVSPTAAVYRAFVAPLRPAGAVTTVRRTDWAQTPPHAARTLLGNDLEPAALAAVPGLEAWRECLDALELAHFRLSGSGSSWFGLYDDDAGARRDLERIQEIARARRLDIRFADIVHPSGFGAELHQMV